MIFQTLSIQTLSNMIVFFFSLCYIKKQITTQPGFCPGCRLGAAMEKVTMQDIADALHISRVTVSKAFNNQSGVSDSMQKLILEKARELGYAKVPYQPDPRQPDVQRTRTVSLIVSRPESAVFWTSIIHRMAQELSAWQINLLYTYVPSVFTKSFSLPSVLTTGSVDGIIVLNVYDPEILGTLSRLSLPKVFLDTVPSIYTPKLTGDLLLIEGFHTVYKITEFLIRDGHKNIGFLGDINYAQTNLERYRGYCACMDRYGLAIQPEYCLTRSIGIFSYEQELNEFFDHLSVWPDAFVCVSDYVAHFVRQYRDGHPACQNHPVTLTGFDNTSEYTNVAGHIITADVPTGLLGKRLALQLLFRTEHPDAPFEVAFIVPSICKSDAASP